MSACDGCKCEVRVRTESRKGKPPAPVRHPSPTLSHPVRGHRHSRTSVYRWSKIGPIDRPRQYVCKHRCERNPNLGKQHAPPRHHSPKSCSLCAATGTVAPPLLDGRKSVASITRANMCASIGVTEYPRSGKLPAPSRHRSPTLSQAVRGGRLTPAAASRWSKIGPIDRPSQHACKHRCDRIPKVRQTARAVAPSLSHTLAGCARPR